MKKNTLKWGLVRVGKTKSTVFVSNVVNIRGREVLEIGVTHVAGNLANPNHRIRMKFEDFKKFKKLVDETYKKLKKLGKLNTHTHETTRSS